MYKTIRHGENSLQYTILPQNDDLRIDGKINGSGHKSKRGKRRSFFAYLGLLFVCTVIIGAILIPLLVSAECLPNPSDWFLKAKIALTKHHETNQSSSLLIPMMANNSTKDNKTESTIKAYLGSNQKNELDTTDVPTTVKEDTLLVATSDNTYTIPNLNNKMRDMDSLKYNILPTEGDSNLADQIYTNDQNKGKKQAITTVILPSEPVTTSTVMPPSFKDTTEESGKNFIPITNSVESALDYQLTKVLTTKKPIILPVLAKTNSVVKENGKLVDKHTESKNWIRSHWPFIDPSTYFQWAGYKSEDSVLLPAILGIALIGIILIVTLCLVARNKKTIVSTVRNRNRNNSEEAGGEDNTTLLTTGGNTSDDE